MSMNERNTMKLLMNCRARTALHHERTRVCNTCKRHSSIHSLGKGKVRGFYLSFNSISQFALRCPRKGEANRHWESVSVYRSQC